MNKWQLEVEKSLIKSEAEALDNLRSAYVRALKDIKIRIMVLKQEELTQNRIYRLEHQKALENQVQAILDKLHGDTYQTIDRFLTESYQAGYIGTMYDIAKQGVPIIQPINQTEAVKAILTDSKISEGLYKSLGVDVDKMKKTITAEIARGIASDTDYGNIARNIAEICKAPESRARTIVRTEGHRIQQASHDDARKAAKKKGADLLKQWDSTLDGATRPVHRRLDGQIREIDEPFEANGKKAMYPGKFGDPALDCNCRCTAITRARWALDEEELETLKKRAKYFGLDKTKDFEEYKQKYLKAAKDDAN